MIKMNERGFMLLSTIFLTLIVSIMAQIFLNANVKIRHRNSALYFTAINLANEQFAFIESIAAKTGKIDTSCHVPAEDLKSYNGVNENSAPVEFEISTIQNGYEVTVKVTWTVNGETETFESVKTILPENLGEVQP